MRSRGAHPQDTALAPDPRARDGEAISRLRRSSPEESGGPRILYHGRRSASSRVAANVERDHQQQAIRTSLPSTGTGSQVRQLPRVLVAQRCARLLSQALGMFLVPFPKPLRCLKCRERPRVAGLTLCTACKNSLRGAASRKAWATRKRMRAARAGAQSVAACEESSSLKE